MARPKEFDIDQALAQAMEVFWTKGYEGTSVQDLVDATGLGRGSLYGTFRDKDRLFQLALERYDRYRQEMTVQTGQPLRDIHRFFDRLVDEGADRSLPARGCFLMNTAMELEGRDERIKSRVTNSLREIESFFRESLDQAKAEGSLREELDTKRAAHVLLGAAFSIRGLSKARPERALLRDIARGALESIGA